MINCKATQVGPFSYIDRISYIFGYNFSQIITQCLSQRSDNFVCPMKIASEWPGLLGCWSCYNSSLLVIFKFETTASRVYGTFTLMDKKSVKT